MVFLNVPDDIGMEPVGGCFAEAEGSAKTGGTDVVEGCIDWLYVAYFVAGTVIYEDGEPATDFV